MTSRRLYRGRYAWALGACFGLFALVALDGIAVGGMGPGPLAFTAVLAAVSAVLAVRGVRSGSVTVTPGGIVVRSLLHTRRLGWDEVSGFATETGMVGAYRRTYLLAHRSDGGLVSWREVNSAPARDGSAAALDAVAAELNAALAEHRAATR